MREECIGLSFWGFDEFCGVLGAPFAGSTVMARKEDVCGQSVGIVPVKVYTRLFVEETGG
jgi:hypothetical protein